MTLRQLQAEQKIWKERNFPGQPAHRSLLGLTEEVGELAHAHLKGEQGIRHTPIEIREQKTDAVGDIVVFLAGYCTDNDLDLERCVERAWAIVKRRDWEKDPLNAALLPEDVADDVERLALQQAEAGQ